MAVKSIVSRGEITLTHMITVAIMDDSLSNAEQIRIHVNSFFDGHSIEHHTDIYNEPNRLLNSRHNPYSIYITDIDLKSDSVSGIDIARRLNQTFPASQVIFITAFDKYFVDVYQTDHIYTVPKPRLNEVLPMALDKAMAKIHKDVSGMIQFSHNKTSFQLPESQVRYMEKALRKIIIYADQQYECYAKFQDLLSQSSSGNLIQCHKSYVVNLHYIKSVNRTQCVLSDNTVIPVSKTYYSILLNRLAYNRNEKAA